MDIKPFVDIHQPGPFKKGLAINNKYVIISDPTEREVYLVCKDEGLSASGTYINRAMNLPMDICPHCKGIVPTEIIDLFNFMKACI